MTDDREPTCDSTCNECGEWPTWHVLCHRCHQKERDAALQEQAAQIFGCFLDKVSESRGGTPDNYTHKEWNEGCRVSVDELCEWLLSLGSHFNFDWAKTGASEQTLEKLGLGGQS